MIVDIGNRGALSLDTDDVTAAYECGEVLSDATGAEQPGTASGHRLILELQRNFGGMRLRALLGAEFVGGATEARLEICVMRAPFDSGPAATCNSRLGGPLIPGMPLEFAAAAMNGMRRDTAAFPPPAGRLRVDRAGHDLMGSSEIAFEQAARLLRVAFWATENGSDVAGALTDGFTAVGSTPRRQAMDSGTGATYPTARSFSFDTDPEVVAWAVADFREVFPDDVVDDEDEVDGRRTDDR